MQRLFVAGMGRTERLRAEVEREHQCGAELVVSMPVVVVGDNGNTFDGLIDAFDLRGHSFARRCYAWYEDEKPITVLKHYPIRTAEEAVRSWLRATESEARGSILFAWTKLFRKSVQAEARPW